MRDTRVIAAELQHWYDRHARDLPWRVPPGRGRADPYRVWLSEVMLQQTTVAAVKAYFQRFTSLWPTIEALAGADEAQVMAEWAGLGYYARARNLIACARAVAAMGAFPDTRAGLAALPGIGPYTSAAIAAIAFERPEAVVDGNVERVCARLFALQTTLPAAKPELRALAASLTPQTRPGDHAQAMMDLGATVCTPRNPACGICPLAGDCRARAAGIAAELPRKAAKPARPQRRGLVWIGHAAHAVLVETRPARGLLGGTLAFPSSGWDGSDLPPPAIADWQEIGLVRHVFTHFTLDLTVMAARLTGAPQRGTLAPLQDFDPGALPGLMRKAWALARPEIAAPLPRARHS
ncbi:A/G-specific adenine glycosylase [Paracoccus sp. (in: a-proteobacteria)]|uniref:A/G-specific adenine glycosylase n=1 Tax=Paracoccus sp. TaxID=267 RepID=UPI0032204EA8